MRTLIFFGMALNLLATTIAVCDPDMEMFTPLARMVPNPTAENHGRRAQLAETTWNWNMPTYTQFGKPFLQAATDAANADGLFPAHWINRPQDDWKVTETYGWVSPNGRKVLVTPQRKLILVIDADTREVIARSVKLRSNWQAIRGCGPKAYAVFDYTGGLGSNPITRYNHTYADIEQYAHMHTIDLTHVDDGNVTFDVVRTGAPFSHDLNVDCASNFVYTMSGMGETDQYNYFPELARGYYGIHVFDASVSPPQHVAHILQDWWIHFAQIHTFNSGPYSGKQIMFALSTAYTWSPDDNDMASGRISTLEGHVSRTRLFGGYIKGASEEIEDTWGMLIVDVTDKNNPQVWQRVSYTGMGYVHDISLDIEMCEHSAFETCYGYLVDEYDTQQGYPQNTRIFDLSNLTHASYVGIIPTGMTSMNHYTSIRNGFLLNVGYGSGAMISDLRVSPTTPPKVGEVRNTGGSFWGAYWLTDNLPVLTGQRDDGIVIINFTYASTAPPVAYNQLVVYDPIKLATNSRIVTRSDVRKSVENANDCTCLVSNTVCDVIKSQYKEKGCCHHTV